MKMRKPKQGLIINGVLFQDNKKLNQPILSKQVQMVLIFTVLVKMVNTTTILL